MPNLPVMPFELEFPEGAVLLSPLLAMEKEEVEEERDGVQVKGRWVAFYNKAGLIRVVELKDRASVAIAAADLLYLGLVGTTALSEALEVHPATIRNIRDRYELGGLEAVIADGRGHHGNQPRKLTKRVLTRAKKLLDQGHPQREVARRVGVSEVAIRNALTDGRLVRDDDADEDEASSAASTPSERACEDQTSSSVGVAVKRHKDRALASVGKLGEADPEFRAAEAVACAGSLLGIPALLAEGLIEAGEKVYGSLFQGFYGLKTILLSLALMALTRVKNPDRLDAVATGEMGILIGMDRFPEKKTIRKKIGELASRGLSHEFATELARRWADAEPDMLGVLYIDGHVRCYHGRKHKIPKAFVQRRKMPMPGDTEYWVNDTIGRPLFFVLPDANEGLLSVMERVVLPEIRGLAGEDRRVTLVFDREGWSPVCFEAWCDAGFDVLTYRKGATEDWPEEEFVEVEKALLGEGLIEELDEVEVRLGHPVPKKEVLRYCLAQRVVCLRKPKKKEMKERGYADTYDEDLGPEAGGFWMREIRRLCPSGHQTAILTTVEEGEAMVLASRMFSRWRQENFFKYLIEEYAIDHAITHAFEEMDPERLVKNPDRKKAEKQREKLRGELAAFEQECGIRKLELEKLGGRPSKQKCRIKESDEEILRKVRKLHLQLGELDAEIASLPDKVPDRRTRPQKEIVKREVERRELTNAIKAIAYRAETWLHRFVTIFFDEWIPQDRAFIKSVFQLPGDIVPDYEAGTLTVLVHPPSTWRWKRGLAFLCSAMTRFQTVYPGTELRLIYEVLE
jgi:hypothetical protein